jgi:hypothetical protein
MDLHELETELNFDIDVELEVDDAPWADASDVIELGPALEA